MTYEEQYLMHHGIKGQQWGVKNGPPYPLDKKTNKLVKNGSINKTVNEYIKNGKAFISNNQNYKIGKVFDDEEYMDWALDNYREAYDHHLIRNTEYNDGKWHPTGIFGESDWEWEEVTEENGNYIPTTEHIMKNKEKYIIDSNSSRGKAHSEGRIPEWDMLTCNPGYGERGTTYNCGFCTTTLEANLRGYDVSARRSKDGSYSNAFETWFKGASEINSDYRDTQNILESYGPNSSGSIDISYPHSSSGHVMHWTVDSNGIFEIQDGQNARRFDSVKEMVEEYGADKTKSLKTYRLDNCELDENALISDGVFRLENNSPITMDRYNVDPNLFLNDPRYTDRDRRFDNLYGSDRDTQKIDEKNKVHNKFSNKTVTWW